MKIIVTADTHSEDLPQLLLKDIAGADLVIHVGDFADISVYRQLKALKDIRAVYGNMDGLDLRGILPRKAVFKCEDVMIGLFHGDGGPGKMFDNVRAAFVKEKVNVVVFGHSHEVFNQVVDGILYFNPGSPTDTFRAAYRSYGVLDINGGKVKGSIIKIK
jgi:putative phosphoesterase